MVSPIGLHVTLQIKHTALNESECDMVRGEVIDPSFFFFQLQETFVVQLATSYKTRKIA